MIPWKVVWRNLMAHKVRSFLTAGSLFIAIFLVCVLHSLVATLNAGVDASSATRLIVQSDVSLFVNLPLAYERDIEKVEGIESICKWQWFGAYYKERKNFFAQFAADEHLFDAYPEIELLEGKAEDFLNRRSSCIIGTGLAEEYGFAVGDQVPLFGTIFPRTNGEAWMFDVVGIYKSKSANLDDRTLFFPWDRLEQALEQGETTGPPGTGIYSLKLKPGADAPRIMAAVDAAFASREQRVKTTTEAEFQRQFVSMLGNIPTLMNSIGFGVLFAIFVAVLNTMLMAARERTRDVGIMKALGFTDRSVFATLLAESFLLCILGGVPGLLLAVGIAGGIRTFIGAYFPGYAVTLETQLLAVCLILGIGLLAGLFPARQASRLRVTQALRMED